MSLLHIRQSDICLFQELAHFLRVLHWYHDLPWHQTSQHRVLFARFQVSFGQVLVPFQHGPAADECDSRMNHGQSPVLRVNHSLLLPQEMKLERCVRDASVIQRATAALDGRREEVARITVEQTGVGACCVSTHASLFHRDVSRF